jgi:hypothetical protein
VDSASGSARQGLAEQIVERARENNVILRISDEKVLVELDGQTYDWPAVWTTGATDVPARIQEGAFILAERLSPAVTASIRRAGAAGADALGTVYARAPGLLVDVRGRRPPAARGLRSAPTSSNLMSAARAKVVFCLLQWPELLHASVRVLAASAGVSVGSAQGTLSALDEEHHLTVGRTGLTRRGELLDQWATAFPAGLGRRLELASFVGDPTPEVWAEAGHVVHASGVYAAEGINGKGMTIYVERVDAKAVMASRWRTPQVANGEVANIVVRRRFWTSAEDSGDEGRGKVLTAPELLVYADLLASGEPRQREVASHLRARLV